MLSDHPHPNPLPKGEGTERKRAAEPNGRLRMKSGGLRQRAWWVLRNRKETTMDGLLDTLCDGSQKAAASNLGRYLRALEASGILKRRVQRASGSARTISGYVVWQLLIDCGVEAPVWRVSRNEVFAPSTGVVYPLVATSPSTSLRERPSLRATPSKEGELND